MPTKKQPVPPSDRVTEWLTKEPSSESSLVFSRQCDTKKNSHQSCDRWERRCVVGGDQYMPAMRNPSQHTGAILSRQTGASICLFGQAPNCTNPRRPPAKMTNDQFQVISSTSPSVQKLPRSRCRITNGNLSIQTSRRPPLLIHPLRPPSPPADVSVKLRSSTSLRRVSESPVARMRREKC